MRVIKADTIDLLTKCYKLREEVFVIEQQVAREDEFDEFEETSKHFVGLDANDDAIGVARWRRTEKGIKLERFAVKKEVRGTGVGSAMVSAVLDDIKQEEGPGQYLYLHAQLEAVPLYAKFNFKEEGERFKECDIWHVTMSLNI